MFQKTKALWMFSLFGLMLGFSSCEIEDSSDVNQDKIHTVYELFYNSNTDITTAIAQFRFGGPTGTILELTYPAYALFNDDTLRFKALYSGHYKEYAGLVTGGAFEYENVDGDKFVNDVPEFEAIAFPIDLDTISKLAAYELEWDGTILSENQGVGVFIGSWTWGEDALFYENALGANSLIMGTAGLSNLAVGTATAYMDRSTETVLLEGTSEGGKIKGKYRAVNKEVVITE